MAKKKNNTEEGIVAVEEALSKTEQFIEKNQKILTYVVGGIIVIILLVFGFQKYVSGPKEKAAQVAIFKAENYFGQDSLDLALHGDGESFGFLDVIDDYGSTPSGNLANYYAGIIYLRKGEYENAIEHLKKFSGDDIIIPGMALGAIGDAYAQLGDYDEAVKYYLDAATKNPNEFVSPAFLMKAGWTYEVMEKWEDALKIFEQLKKEYPKAREVREIDRYIANAKIKLNKL